MLVEEVALHVSALDGDIAEVTRRGKVVGFDIAELNPPHDAGGNTARIATWLVTHFLSEIFEQRA